ncbi:MAG: YfiR family protein [Candidatus Didemnitutus sp.]|nr:YfiR family protein [Candidatus Didemnitutus sp.]
MKRYRSLLAAACLLLGLAVPLLMAQRRPESAPTELESKALFIFYFATFVDWPKVPGEGETGPLTVGVMGREELVEGLRRVLNNRTVRGRPIVVQPVDADAVAERLDIIFFGRDAPASQGAALTRLAGSPVLTVGETEGFCQRGGMINFYINEGRIFFEINPAATERAKLKLSSRLLSLARLVGEPVR